MNKDNFYIDDLTSIRAFCINSDKEDVYKYIYSLQQENEASKQTINELTKQIAKLVEDKKQLKEQRKKLVKICWKNDLEITSEENELLEDLYDLVRGDSNE